MLLTEARHPVLLCGMNSTSSLTDLAYWTSLVRQTRRYGACYVHSARRTGVRWDALRAVVDGREVKFSYCGWGRSLQGGGHKYKCHVNYVDDGKPVRSARLGFLRPLSA